MDLHLDHILEHVLFSRLNEAKTPYYFSCSTYVIRCHLCVKEKIFDERKEYGVGHISHSLLSATTQQRGHKGYHHRDNRYKDTASLSRWLGDFEVLARIVVRT